MRSTLRPTGIRIVRIALVLMMIISTLHTSAQIQSNRLRFRYQLDNGTLQRLERDSIFLVDDKGYRYQMCELARFKFFVTTHSQFTLKLDPWALKGSQMRAGESCRADRLMLSPATPSTLRIELPKRDTLGSPTAALRLPYRAWLLQVVSLGIKVRPPTQDYRDSLYASNVLVSGLNLGISIGRSYGVGVFTNRTFHTVSFTPSVGVGFSSTSLSREPLRTNISTALTPNNFIVSPNISVIIGRNDLGLILACGIDLMTGRNANCWAYQGRPFWGVGIAAGLRL